MDTLAGFLPILIYGHPKLNANFNTIYKPKAKIKAMKVADPYHLIAHSLGHTSTGKLIEEFNGNINQFRVAHLKWSAKDHNEAFKILTAKSKKVEDGAERGYIEILAGIHREEAKYKQKKLLVEQQGTIS